MKKIALICIPVYLMAVWFYGCKKESVSPTPDPPKEYHLPAEGLEYTQLSPGMYLVYRDSATNTEDSVLVDYSVITQKFSPEKSYSGGGDLGFPYTIPAYYYDVLTLKLLKANAPAGTWFLGSTAKLGEYMTGISMSDVSNLVVFQFPRGGAFDMQIEGNTYHEVLRFFSTNGFPETDSRFLEQTLFWAKEVGIIKWQKKNSSGIQTFTLLRHG